MHNRIMENVSKMCCKKLAMMASTFVTCFVEFLVF
jgi:hypothetical protein